MLRSRFVAVLVSVAVLWSPAGAGADSGESGWARPLGDDQGTWRGGSDGPAVPAVRWTHRAEGTSTTGRQEGPAFGHKDLVAIDGHGQILVRMTRGATESLVALDGDTGGQAWRRDGIAPGCPPTVGPDGTIWIVFKPTSGDPYVLQGLDPATGATKPDRTFSRETDTSDDPMFQPCQFTGGLRFLSDGTILIRERSLTTTSEGEWLRAIDGDTMDQRWVSKLMPSSGNATANSWWPDLRVGREGADNADVIYLLERVGDTASGPFGLRLHSYGADGMPIDLVTVPGTDLPAEDAELVVDGRALYGSAFDDASGVTGRIWRVDDDGAGNLSVAWQRTTANAAAHASDTARYHLTDLTLGDGGTLIARTFNSTGTVVGIRASDGRKVWDLAQFDCLTGHVVVDASGYGYFIDFCRDVLVSVAPTGWVRSTMPLNGDAATIGGGTVSLDGFEAFRVQAITPDGDVVLTAKADDDDDVVVLTIGLGDMVERRAGTGRLETAIEISRTTFPAGADTVVIARADQYPDALAGAPLAVAEGGPLLLSERATLSDVTAAEITRLGASHAILLGGAAALDPSVRTALEGRGLTVERLSGANRFDTARRIKDRIGTDTAVIVEGANADPGRGWPDAVAASGWAASTGRAILLVARTSLPAETAAALEGVSAATVVGGAAAVSPEVEAAADAIAGDVDRIFGSTRYDTSAKVAARSLADGNDLDVVWLATGTAFPDALTAGPASALTGGVLLLVHGGSPAGSPESLQFLSDRADDIGVVYLVGGAGAIGDATAAAVNEALGR